MIVIGNILILFLSHRFYIKNMWIRFLRNTLGKVLKKISTLLLIRLKRCLPKFYFVVTLFDDYCTELIRFKQRIWDFSLLTFIKQQRVIIEEVSIEEGEGWLVKSYKDCMKPRKELWEIKNSELPYEITC